MDLNGKRILVADDDRIVRRIVVTKLSGLGYELVEAQDGQEAMEWLENGEVPDLLITDQLMPRMNGLQLARAVREHPNPAIAGLPIIMLTSRGSEHNIIEGLDDYVIKPFSPDELARVRTVLWRTGRLSWFSLCCAPTPIRTSARQRASLVLSESVATRGSLLY